MMTCCRLTRTAPLDASEPRDFVRALLGGWSASRYMPHAVQEYAVIHGALFGTLSARKDWRHMRPAQTTQAKTLSAPFVRLCGQVSGHRRAGTSPRCARVTPPISDKRPGLCGTGIRGDVGQNARLMGRGGIGDNVRCAL
ncbi:hypothetical protein THIX_10457 [Thiomonas sp. X19]|nr:hypothetical protein THIX_10457 [Thiomonas sp. X19]